MAVEAWNHRRLAGILEAMKYGRRDGNHAEIVKRLRSAGSRVLDLGDVGEGCPDTLVAWGGQMLLMEIKDGKKPPSARRLTPQQEHFHATWPGPVVVVTSVEQALAATGVIVAPCPPVAPISKRKSASSNR